MKFKEVQLMQVITTVVVVVFAVFVFAFLGFETVCITSRGRFLLDLLLMLESVGSVVLITTVVFINVLAYNDLVIVYSIGVLGFIMLAGNFGLLFYLILNIITANSNMFPSNVANDLLYCCKYYADPSVSTCAGLGPCTGFSGTLGVPWSIYALLAGTAASILFEITLLFCVFFTHDVTRRYLMGGMPSVMQTTMVTMANVGTQFNKHMENRWFPIHVAADSARSKKNM